MFKTVRKRKKISRKMISKTQTHWIATKKKYFRKINPTDQPFFSHSKWQYKHHCFFFFFFFFFFVLCRMGDVRIVHICMPCKKCILMTSQWKKGLYSNTSEFFLHLLKTIFSPSLSCYTLYIYICFVYYYFAVERKLEKKWTR